MVAATVFLEHDNISFSVVLSSKEAAEAIRHVVKESNKSINPDCNDRTGPQRGTK